MKEFQRVVAVVNKVDAAIIANRHTEEALASAGFKLEIQERLKLAPFIPAFRGLATR